MGGLAKLQVVKATTNSPFTRNFKHLLSFPMHWLKRSGWDDPKIKSVPPKDRIKYWNIVPGDTVADRRDPHKILREVLAINKISNRVFLKPHINEGKDDTEKQKALRTRQIHYSRCQLFLGDEKVVEGEKLVSKPVFALRITARNKRWSPIYKRYIWDRWPLAMQPKLPDDSELVKSIKREGTIPWPKPEEDPPVQANPHYDTPQDVVTEITYKLPILPEKLSRAIPKPASEAAYINSLFNPSPIPFDESKPMEAHVVKELSNPHSRAKKQARWQQLQRDRDSLRKELVATELKNLSGRNKREATAEALYKWRQRLEDEKRERKKERWLTTERMKKIERKKKTKAQKLRRKGERLRDLVLQAAPNQVLPVGTR